jgi:hypothetical protein
MSELLVDRAGRRRSAATMPGFHVGRPPRNKGLRYPADPPKVEEIVAVLRAAGDDAHELAREGVPLIVIQRQLGHSNLGITSVYLQGIDNAEIIETVHARRQPMIPVTTFPRRWSGACRAAQYLAKQQRTCGQHHSRRQAQAEAKMFAPPVTMNSGARTPARDRSEHASDARSSVATAACRAPHPAVRRSLASQRRFAVCYHSSGRKSAVFKPSLGYRMFTRCPRTLP